MLLLRADGQTSCEEVKWRTEAKIAEVEQKLLELQRMRQALLQVATLCTGQGPASACPMLDALDQQETLDQIVGREASATGIYSLWRLIPMPLIWSSAAPRNAKRRGR